jgi:flagellar basal body P-ring formation protein FlgA
MSSSTAALRRCAARALVGILTLAAGALTLSAAAEPSQWQSPESIRDAARELVLSAHAESTAVTVDAIAVDERLKLPACSAPLEAQAQGAFRNGRGTVAVSCAGAQPWRLFVPVRAHVAAVALVAKRNLQAGEVIAADDVELREASSASLPYEFLTEPAQAAGLTVRRTIPAGTVLVPAALERPRVIERGALVTLISGRGAVAVRGEGVALEAAGLRQRVRVRAASGRVVEGVVESATEVRVGS